MQVQEQPMTGHGLRARKKRATRDRLVSVALDLCAASGFASTTVESIAEAAEVSTRTFFHYFPTKQDVFLGHEHDLLAGLVADVERAPAGQRAATALWDAVEALAKRFDDDAEQLRPLYALVIAEPSLHRRSLELQVTWEHELATALVPRLSGRDRYGRAHVLAATALACLRTNARVWATEPRPRPLHHAVSATRRSLLDDLDQMTVRP
jgi:AcrR family transcriptional regulator